VSWLWGKDSSEFPSSELQSLFLTGWATRDWFLFSLGHQISPHPITKAILLIAVCVSIVFSSDLTAQNATPMPTAATPATPETPAARSLASPAPPAVYFLRQWASVKTHDSVRGYPPGTPLTVVGNFGDHLKVKAGEVEFEVKINQVTNDPQIATQASQRDVRQQQQRSEAQQWEIAQTDQSKGQHDKRRDLEARYRGLQEEEDDLLLQIGNAEQEEKLPIAETTGQKRERSLQHRDYQNGPLVAELPFLRSHLKDVQHEKNEVRSQLEQAQRSLQKQP
jgi:hypothetical protein